MLTKEDKENIYQQINSIFDRLVDSETGFSISQMELVKNLEVDDTGVVRFTFQPTSFFCASAERLCLSACDAIKKLSSVKTVYVTIKNHIHASRIERQINEGLSCGFT